LLSDGRNVVARAIANAAGPWVMDVLGRLGETGRDGLRLVKGSHIVVPRLWEGEQAYILQQPDGRIVFALPFETLFTLIGTTDIPVASPEDARISADEIRYLCEAADRYFLRQLVPADVVWSYSGIRSLHDDGSADAKAVTRDYHLALAEAPGAGPEPALLSVFGGKITTARALAEKAVDMLGIEGRRSTGWRMLPGGDIHPGYLDWLDALSEWMPASLVLRLSRAYGTRLRDLIGDARRLEDLGRHYGAGLYEREVAWLVEREYARTAEDVLWRRTKLGLHMSEAEKKAVAKRLGG
jgi:glycerol-3-phosphate dehydrogenase